MASFPAFASDDWMHLQWLALAGDSFAHCYTDVLARLDEPHRHYHTRHHIAALLQLAADHEHLIQDLHTLRWAVWYHDAVYDPRSAKNEEESALLAQSHLSRMGVSTSQLDRVGALILATKTHSLPAGDADGDCALFLDLDLSVLGADRPVYQQYSAAVRREFSMYPALLYNPGRRKVLKKFLQKDRIYFTHHFHSLWDAQARANLNWELSQL